MDDRIVFDFRTNGLRIPLEFLDKFTVLNALYIAEPGRLVKDYNIRVSTDSLKDLSRLFVRHEDDARTYVLALPLDRLEDLKNTLDQLGAYGISFKIAEVINERELEIMRLQEQDRTLSKEKADEMASSMGIQETTSYSSMAANPREEDILLIERQESPITPIDRSASPMESEPPVTRRSSSLLIHQPEARRSSMLLRRSEEESPEKATVLPFKKTRM